jgi:hypothetical protein
VITETCPGQRGRPGVITETCPGQRGRPGVITETCPGALAMRQPLIRENSTILARGGGGILKISGRMPWLWLWGTGVAFLIEFVLTLSGFLKFAPVGLYAPVQYLAWALYAIAVLWVVVNPRPAIAMTVYLAVTYDVTDGFNGLTYHIVFGPAWTWIFPAASSVALLAGATWRLRRQAVT